MITETVERLLCFLDADSIPLSRTEIDDFVRCVVDARYGRVPFDCIPFIKVVDDAK